MMYFLLFLIGLTFVASEQGVYEVEHLGVNGSDFRRLLVGNGGRLFVGGRNALIQMSVYQPDLYAGLSKLQIEESVNTSCTAATCSDLRDNFPSLMELIAIGGKEFIVFCGSGVDRACRMYNASDITQSWPIMERFLPAQSGERYFGSYQTSVMVKYRTSRKTVVFALGIPFSGKDDTTSHFAFSLRVLVTPNVTIAESLTYYASRHYSSSSIRASSGYQSEFVYAFENASYGYFLRNIISNAKTRDKIAYISQVCRHDTYFRSYMETKLECSGLTSLDAATSIETPSGVLLLASFSRHSTSAVCVYHLNEIERLFEEEQIKCFRAESGSTPDWISGATPACADNTHEQWNDIKCGYTNENPRILISRAVQEDAVLLWGTVRYTALTAGVNTGVKSNTTVLYHGSELGQVGKVLYNAVDHRAKDIGNIRHAWPAGRINSMRLSFDKTSLIVLQSDRVKVYDRCGLYTTCESCLNEPGCAFDCRLSLCRPNSTVANDQQLVFSEYCPPTIKQVQPSRGPVQGGTSIVIKGKFSPASPRANVTVLLGDKSCLNLDTTQLPLKLTCTAPNVTSPIVAEVSVYVGGALLEFDPFSVQYWGRSMGSSLSFHYLELRLESNVTLYARESGLTQLKLWMQHLDKENTIKVLIGSEPCNITANDRISNTSITCKSPALPQGSYQMTVHVDGAVLSGPNVRYLADTTAEPFDAHTIVSGGITVTMTGDSLQGLGSGLFCKLVNQTTHEPVSVKAPCDIIVGDTTAQLRCKTGKLIAWTSLEDPVVGISISNSYTELVKGNVTVHPDPVIPESPFRLYSAAFVVSKLLNYTLKGKYFGSYLRDDIDIRLGSIPCPLVALSNTSVTCAPSMTPNIDEYDVNLTVTVRVGSHDYGNVGTVRFEKQAAVGPGPSTNSLKDNDTQSVLIVGILVTGITFIVIAIVLAVCLRSKRRKKDAYSVEYRNDSNILTLDGLSESHTSDALQQRQNNYQERGFLWSAGGGENSGKDTEALVTAVDDDTLAILQEKHLLISSQNLILGEIVGQGHFGCVFKAYLQKPGVKEEEPVAAKTMNRTNPKDLDVSMFLKEALIMKDFCHRNVMQLVGICFGIEKLPLVVLPFMNKGDVLTYIRDVNNVPTVRDLVIFSVDIANGMDYLSQLKFVHRDLAARNCMIDDDMTVKVADFGLSRDVYEKEYYSSCDKKTKLPVKWMSPESLEFGHFSHKSDVWSFGVVLWELLTRGMNPYPTVDNWDMMRYLKAGRRLNKPDFCPDEMYNIMVQCWSWEAADRPGFGELTTVIPQLLRKLERITSKRKRIESLSSQRSDRSAPDVDQAQQAQ